MTWKDASPYVGFFLATSEIKRSNPWTTGLIIFVMTLTFFNMVLLNGVLGGLVQGILGTFRLYYSSDVFITPVVTKNTIEQTDLIQAVIESLPTKQYVTNRFTHPSTVEYGYQTKLRTSDVTESASGLLTGIDPIAENRVTNLAKMIVAGSYLDPHDSDYVLVGSSLIQKYTTVRGSVSGNKILKTADIGSKVKLKVNGVEKEVTIKGVIRTDNSAVDGRIYMVEETARKLMGRKTFDANEIAIKLKPGNSDIQAKTYILQNIPYNEHIIIQTADEAVPSGTAQVTQTFNVLGNIVGFIALIVGAITIFIVIYVNAITRRKYIGILKGIGISSHAIELSYVLQSLFYAGAGIVIAGSLILGILVPYFKLHPINYPLGQGSLAITPFDVAIRAVILTLTAFTSGFIPAWLVTKQNTLDAILGR